MTLTTSATKLNTVSSLFCLATCWVVPAAVPAQELEWQTAELTSRNVSQRHGDSGLGFVQRKLSTERKEFQITDSFMPVDVDGAYDRVCRGSDPSDDNGSYYIVRGEAAAESLESCKRACVDTPGCRGIEFRPGRCEVWVRAGGIQATAVTLGVLCLRYVPFVLAAGLEDRACRGKDEFDNNPAYYEITTTDTLAACQDLCLQRNLANLGSSGSLSWCRGIEFGGNRCELWTRTEGIGASVELSGVVCQPLSPFVLMDAMDRGCSARSDDVSSSFYTSYANVSLQGCKALCAEHAPFCKGIEFTNAYCHVWTRVSGIEKTVPRSGAMCLRHGETGSLGDAFEKIDGGSDRACRGMNTSDWSPSYFEFFAASKSIEDCKSRCLENPMCQGIELNGYGCKVWTVIVTTSIGFSGTTCLRYSAFAGVDGGARHGCYGVDPVETTALQFPADSVAEQCRSACAQSVGCQGVEYNETSCEVWSSRILGSYANVNRSCMRYKPFIAVHGGMDRACRGMLPDDAWPGYYTRHVSILNDLSLQECKALCTSTTGCKGIQYDVRTSVKTCLVWKRRGGIQMSSDQSGTLCLRLGIYDPFEDSSAFESLGHGTCSGAVFSVYPNVNLDRCKLHCIAVPGCRGLDFGPEGCRIWLSEVAINSVNMTSDLEAECFSYEPFRDVDGGMGRDCRGHDGSDLDSSYFMQFPAASLQACQDLCVQQAEGDVVGKPCKGIAYDSTVGSCRLWVRSQGIGATAELSNAVCQRYEPFLDLDGGSGRACQGVGASYTYNLTQVANLEHCRSLCLASGCRGVEFSSSGCKLWSNNVKATQVAPDSICLQFGVKLLAEFSAAADAFVAVHGGLNRGCRGSNASDVDASYFTSVGPARAGSLEACKILCMRTSACNAIQFSSSECQLWTRDEGVEATVMTEGVQCLKLQPFRDFDGSQDRLCEAASQPDGVAVGSLRDCQDRCYESVRCTGINFNNGICHVFTGAFSSHSSPGSRCSSFQPFVSVDGGVDRDCRGAHEDDTREAHYLQSEASTLEDCKLQCLFHPMCKGVAFSGPGCKLWTRTRGIQASKFASGYVCLKLGVTDPLYDLSVSAFTLIDGGHNRACRGQDVFDNLDSHFTVHLSWPENSSVEACQSLCMRTPACKGIEFRSGACEVWTLAGGIQATVASIGRACFRYEPFQTLDGFEDRVCRGSNPGDSQASYYSIYAPSETPTLDSCKELCIRTQHCKGIEYRGWCEVWTRPQGIDAVAPSIGSQCLQYRPFMTVEGGTNRECRGADPSDKRSSYFVAYGATEATSLEDCKSLCVRTVNCKGVTYSAGNCEVWTRRGGIQGSAYSSGSLCLRLGPADVWDDNNAFRPLSSTSLGFGTCHAPGMSLLSYGPEAASSLQVCKLKCMSTPSCRGIAFNSTGCFVWLGSGTLSTNPDAESICLSYEPFRDVDGGMGRDCRGHDGSDLDSSHFMQFPAASLQVCQDLCVQQAEGDVVGKPCKGIAYDSTVGSCRLWVRSQGIEATAELSNAVCQRYEPFLDLDGGSGRACRGAHGQDIQPHYFVEYGPAQASNLDTCRSLCIATPGCRGIEHDTLNYRCMLWSHPVQTTVGKDSSICLRLGLQPVMEIASNADAFQPIDGAGRACRGTNATDTHPDYYVSYSPSEVATLAACKAMCVGTPDCQGIQFSIYGCQVWTRPEGIENTAISPALSCLRYSPFRLIDGFEDRSCRGQNSTDTDLNFWYSQVSSAQVCQQNCLQTPECTGIEYDRSTSGCKVWTTSILASVVSNRKTCMRYEPFFEADGGTSRSCSGPGGESWPSYYLVYNHTWTSGPSIDECKERCLAVPGCRGLEYTKTSCKVWTRTIQSTVLRQGSLCLRFGSFDPHELLDAFVAVHGGLNRGCRGSNASDVDASYFTSVGPARAGSLEACKILCMRTSACNAIQFSSSECQLWTRDEGVEATVMTEGVQCLKLQPFRDFDGSQDRLCEAASQPDGVAVGSLRDCQDRCYESVRCTGINFNNGICHVFTGTFSSHSSPGSRCSSFQPFVSVDGGVDRDCRGAHEDDISEEYFVRAQVPTLEECKLQCLFHSTCIGLAFSSGDCKLWTRSDGIRFSKFQPGSTCLRYHMSDSLLVDCAFEPVDGGKDRACRGMNESDNLDSHYTVHLTWPENSSVESCQDLCQNTLGCKGIEFRLGACEIWMLTEGIQASVWAAGRTCMRYEPFQSVDGFNDRVCRGSNATDSLDEYFDIYSPLQAPTLEACQNLCSTTSGCQGIEYRGWCEVWTRPDGIMATAYSPGSQCLTYKPFVGVDGGSNRACRGSHPGDTWSSYYELYDHQGQDPVESLDKCKSLCMANPSCKGIEYRDGRCEVWTRRAGIGSSAASTGSMCLRKGVANGVGIGLVGLDAFEAVFGANKTCLGSNSTEPPSVWGPESVATEEECRALCMSTPGCTGIDFTFEGCRVWTYEIQSSAPQAGSTCLAYDAFEAVDGGEDRACRGFDSADDSAFHYIWRDSIATPSLSDCKLQCMILFACKGISFDASGCQIWTRDHGIQASIAFPGSKCLRYVPFTPISLPGKDQACLGTSGSFHAQKEISSLELCRVRCVETPGCTAVDFGALGCRVWMEDVIQTEERKGSTCLRYGSMFSNASAFKPVNGGINRACRGMNASDNSDSYYDLFWSWPENSSISACQDRCVRTPGCQGIEFRQGGCEVWLVKIESFVFAGERTCMRYEPFQSLDGFDNRVCRGSNLTDSMESYYSLKSPDETPTFESCQNLCVTTPACKGVEYRANGWCEIWTRPDGISAVAPSLGASCLRYEPFVFVDGGVNRACRGASVSDNWQSYYNLVSSDSSANTFLSLAECKSACLSTWNCKGIEYDSGQCKVWHRSAGIGTTVPKMGAVCMRFGPATLATTDAFVEFQGGQDRSCRGSDVSDIDPSYYILFGPARASTLEECKVLCVSTPDCRGVDFSESGCQVWTRDDGILSSSSEKGSVCLTYEPFQTVDGGTDRECRSDGVNLLDSVIFYDAALAPSLQICKQRCAARANLSLTTQTQDVCKGISFNESGCVVWLVGIQGSTPSEGNTCLRFEPFIDINGGQDQSCRGAHVFDDSSLHYRSFSRSEVLTLEECRSKCVEISGCRGIEFNQQDCRVWLKAEGIGTTVQQVGSICLRFGSPDPFRAASAFHPVDGGLHRACRGANESDNSEAHWKFHSISEVRTLEACEMRCIFTAGCVGIEFNRWGCEIWMRTEGIETSVYAPGYQCFRYEPFRSADGFDDRACRGANIDDNNGEHFTAYQTSSSFDGTLLDCKRLCATTSSCKGIEYLNGRCEVWTRSAGIGATAPALGLQCLRYEPFLNVEGGIDRACRGADPFDDWPSYYTLTSTSSVQECQQLCMGTNGCNGIEYSRDGRCELWTRDRGIGSSASSVGSICMRYGSWDPSEVLDGFLPADGGLDRACRGVDRNDFNSSHYSWYALDMAPTLDACKAICTITPGCKGVEYSHYGCEVWTRYNGIEATAEVSGIQCYRYVAFEAVDGGHGRACRGANEEDSGDHNYILLEIESLGSCQAQCLARPGCKGVSYSPQGCELWTRSFGIGSSVAQEGSFCYRHEPFTSADGGKDRACRGAKPWDNSTEHFREVNLRGGTLAKCKALCVGSPGCKGIEFKPTGACLIWTRPGGIDATAPAPGSICLRYGATQAGTAEEGSRIGQIHVASDPELCLDVGGLANGNPVQVWPCANATRFVLNNDSTAQIRWLDYPNKCLDVDSGIKSNGTRMQIWDCGEVAHPNMQFLFPDSGIGQIRWAVHLDMCLDTASTAGSQVFLWSCRRASGNSRLVLPPGEFRTVRQTKFVGHYLPWFLGNNVNEACTQAGPSCTYKNDHWCLQYGNSYYSSYLGAYDISDETTIDTQLDLMASSGLDGLWIDYQMSTWDDHVDRLVAGLKTRGMGFAIMVDSATFPDVMITTAAKVVNWTQEPHYYRHQGLPIVPIWNNNETIFSPLPVNAIYISRIELVPPEWASDTYTWVSDTYLERYYEEDHPVVSSGSVFRGYRDCYFDKTLLEPNVSLLDITLQRARRHRPEFIQITTWNDYTEGTQLEPSWLRRNDECVDVCGENCLLTTDCHSYGLHTDCTKPVGMAFGPADPSCNISGNLSAFAEINQVAEFIARERQIGRALVAASSVS